MDDDCKSLSVYERHQLVQIESFKKEEPGVINQGIGKVLKPLTWLIEKVIPVSAIQGALFASNSVAKFMTDINDIKRDANINDLKELRNKELELCDKLANNVHNWAIGVATAEGAVAGGAGIIGLTADMPFIGTMALRTIYKIGACYGYGEDNELNEKFVLGILSISGANSIKEKEAALLLLKNIEVMLIENTWRTIAEKAANQMFGREASVIAIKNLAKQLGINLTKRKALQAIPIIGAAVGASVNGWFMKELGWVARRKYQERWLLDNGKL